MLVIRHPTLDLSHNHIVARQTHGSIGGAVFLGTISNSGQVLPSPSTLPPHGVGRSNPQRATHQRRSVLRVGFLRVPPQCAVAHDDPRDADLYRVMTGDRHITQKLTVVRE